MLLTEAPLPASNSCWSLSLMYTQLRRAHGTVAKKGQFSPFRASIRAPFVLCTCFHALGHSIQTLQEGSSRNLSTAELLLQAESEVVRGFVPPILARVLYDEKSRPWSAAIADSARNQDQQQTTQTESKGRPMRKQPDLTSYRRASGSQAGSASEEVYTESQFYGDAIGCSDVVATIEQAGLGALFPGKADALLSHGRPSFLKANSTNAPPELGGWEHACGVAYLSAPRSSVLLSTSFGSSPSLNGENSPSLPPPAGTIRSTWWANVSLSEEAKNRLHSLAILLKERKGKHAQEAALGFFR